MVITSFCLFSLVDLVSQQGLLVPRKLDLRQLSQTTTNSVSVSPAWVSRVFKKGKGASYWIVQLIQVFGDPLNWVSTHTYIKLDRLNNTYMPFTVYTVIVHCIYTDPHDHPLQLPSSPTTTTMTVELQSRTSLTTNRRRSSSSSLNINKWVSSCRVTLSEHVVLILG